MIKKAIVTGANGFIGSELVNELTKRGVHVIAVVRSRNSNISRIASLAGVDIVYCDMDDIHNLPDLIHDDDIDVCFHLAWTGSYGEERAYYEMQMRNVSYALHIVDTLAKMGVKRFVGAGTLAEKDVLNYHGEDGAVPNAVSFYGIAKLMAHYMTKTECTKLGLDHVWCYLSNTYAAGSTTNNFVMMACKMMLNGERAAFTSGEQMYDFMYVTDTVRAFYYAAEYGKKNSAYYLGSNKPRKLKDYIFAIRDAINPDIILYLGDIPYYGKPLPAEEYDGDKLYRETGFVPEIEFEEGIRKTVAWLRNSKEERI